MAAIQRNPDLSQDEKKNRGEVKMRELYSASGNAKVRGAVEQVERALEEGELRWSNGHSWPQRPSKFNE